jgi:flagella basal body P-ring formation protein FlgA
VLACGQVLASPFVPTLAPALALLGLGGAPRIAAAAPGADNAMAQIPPAVLERALALATESARLAAPASARIVVEAGSLDARLRLAPCERVEAYLPAGVPPWGRTRVGLRCAAGPTRWNVSLPVQVQVLAPALVVVAALPAGGTLTAAHLRRVETDWALSRAPLCDDLLAVIGRTVQRNLAPGEVLQASLLRTRLWFAQGDTVRVEISGSGFAIFTDAVALAPGVEGRNVKVQTEGGRVLIGRPAGDRRIEVAL